MAQAVLFDLDNTLHDFESSCKKGLEAVAQVYPDILGTAPLDDLYDLYFRLLEQTYEAFLRGGTTLEGSRVARMQAFLAHWGREASHHEAAEAYRVYRATYVLGRRAYPEVTEVLEALNQTHRLAIVSNGTREEQEECAWQIGASPFIEFVLTPDQEGSPKPDPAMIRIAAARLGVDLKQVTMVGDSWRSDVGAALAAGVRAVWLNRGGRECPDPGKAVEILDLRALPTLLHAHGL